MLSKQGAFISPEAMMGVTQNSTKSATTPELKHDSPQVSKVKLHCNVNQFLGDLMARATSASTVNPEFMEARGFSGSKEASKDAQPLNTMPDP